MGKHSFPVPRPRLFHQRGGTFLVNGNALRDQLEPPLYLGNLAERVFVRCVRSI